MSKKKKAKRSAASKSLNINRRPHSWNGLEGFAFDWEGKTYWVNKFSEAGILTTVREDREFQETVVTAKQDFGGLGKDALKPVITPFRAWIERVCREL